MEQIIKLFGPEVNNEAQLIYFLRIIFPYLQRVKPSDDRMYSYNIDNKYLDIIAYTYKVIGDVISIVHVLKYEDTICDLLYQFKYLFVGYYLNEQIKEAIIRFPNSMKEKLKFLLTHSSSVESSMISIQQHQMSASRQSSTSQMQIDNRSSSLTMDQTT